MSKYKVGNRALDPIKAAIRGAPRTIAHSVANRAGPAMTSLSREAFAAGQSVYGEPRPEGVNGSPLTLRKTGATEGALRFRVAGTIIRCVLGTPYAKYLVGKYGILPNGALPVSWIRKLDQIVAETKV